MHSDEAYYFLKGGGENAALIANTNWAETPLGPVAHWPKSLQSTLANMLHSAFPMFLFWGPDLICFYNDAYRPSLGTEGRHPAIGQKGHEVWAHIWDFTGPLIRDVLGTAKPVWFQDQLVPIYRNGHLENVYWTFSYSPAYGDNGTIEGVLVTCMETTDSVNARHTIEKIVASRTEELAEANASIKDAYNYLQGLINISREPMQVLSPVIENGEVVDFRFRLTNAAYATYAACTPEDLVNRRVGDIFPGYFETSSFSRTVNVYKTGVAESWEIHYNKDGLDLHNHMSAARYGEDVVLHFTDFTRLKHAELALLHKIEELNRSNIKLEEFAYAASHDLKEPIRKLEVFAKMLKGQLQPRLRDEEAGIFERIEKSTRQMRALVDDLLAYSEVTQGEHEKESVSLGDVIKQVLDDLELTIHESSAEITVDTLPVITGHKRQIQQLFQNLIANALKFHKPSVPPLIVINADKAVELGRTYHIIEVRDYGIGFEAQYSDKIFQIFSRLHNKETFSGTGIGLSIVKRVVENHDGMIRAEGVPGEGAAFKMYFPAG